jgi:glutamate dehydrogenase (NAD(P)+)
VSYFEWTQNIQRFRWELDRVNDELGKTMRKAYRAVRESAEEKKIDMRTAVFVLAVQRVARAAMSRIQVNTDLGFGV